MFVKCFLFGCSSYLTSVKDVLTSVQKTEESLRRLKKIRDKSAGSLSSEVAGISDDEKIRIQLQVDVQAYVNIVRFFCKYLLFSTLFFCKTHSLVYFRRISF